MQTNLAETSNIFFFYGLSFLVMGFVVLSRIRRTEIGGFRLLEIFWILGLFAILHGANEFAELLVAIQAEKSIRFASFQDLLLITSFIVLFWFGFRLINMPNKTVGAWFPAVCGCALFISLIYRSGDFSPALQIYARYFIATPAAVMTGIGFLLYYRKNLRGLACEESRKYLIGVGGMFLLYAVLSGLIVNPADSFPASIINKTAFISLVGAPVEIFRGIFALAVAWFVWEITNVFNEREAEEHKSAEQKITSLARFPSENPNPILRIGSDGRILYANGAGVVLLEKWKTERGGAAPKEWRDIVADSLRSNVRMKNIEVPIGENVFSFTASPIEGIYVNLYGRDVTEQTRSSKKLERARDELENRVDERTAELKETNTILRREITERIGAEEALAEKERESSSIIRTASETICKLDNNGCFLFMSPDGLRTLGLTLDEIRGRFCSWVVKPEFHDTVEKNLEVAREGQITRFEYQSDTILGPRWFEGVLSPQRDSDGDVSAIMFLSRDITDRKKEAELNEALNRLNAAISSTLNFNEIIEQVAIDAGAVIGCRSATIAMRRGDDWIYKYAVGELPEGLVGRTLSNMELTLFAATIRNKRPIVAKDARADDRFDRSVVEDYGIRAFLAAPLIINNEVFGVIAFYFHDEPVAFTGAQVDFIRKLGVSASLALENAQLFSIQQDISNRLQESLLTVAQKIEGIHFGHLYRSVMPTITKVGGDFYDIFEIEGNKICILVGDVSGKGLESATLATISKDTIKAYAFRGHIPPVVISMTNQVVSRVSGEFSFVTVFFGILNLTTGELFYCNAGQTPPLIKKRSGAVEVLKIGDPGIGIFDHLKFSGHRIKMVRGDILIGHTDGVLEARIGKELFGERKLMEFIESMDNPKVENIPQRIVQEMQDMGCDLTDDIALLAVSLSPGFESEAA